MALIESNKPLLRELTENYATCSNSPAITLQLRHEVPMEVDLAATSFKAAVTLIPGDTLSIAGELLTAAAAQLKTNA